MAQLSISEAIKRSPVGKSQFYAKYIQEGVITVSVDSAGKKYIDSSELIRVFGKLSGIPADSVRSDSEPDNTGLLKSDGSNQSEIIELLKKQIADLKSESNKREAEAIKREEHYQSHIDALTLRLEPPVPARDVKKENWLLRWWNAKD